LLVIQVSRVHKSFSQVVALDDISLETQAPSRLVIAGPSGSGKTTLLRLIAGLELPDAGEIRLDGALASCPGQVIPPGQRRLGFVFQTAALWPHLTVAQQILFGLASWPRAKAFDRLQQLLARIKMTDLASRYPHQISGGEARRVALARSLAPRPRHLLLDEPLTNVDQDLKRELLALIHEEVEQSRADLVYVTHNPEEAGQIATRLVVLRAGRLQEVSKGGEPP
jgi:iron(III) transport system ATP-binding protein